MLETFKKSSDSDNVTKIMMMMMMMLMMVMMVMTMVLTMMMTVMMMMMTMWQHECARSVAFGAKRAIELEMNQTDLKY